MCDKSSTEGVETETSPSCSAIANSPRASDDVHVALFFRIKSL